MKDPEEFLKSTDIVFIDEKEKGDDRRKGVDENMSGLF